MREEVIGFARLILGDCRDVLPTLSGVDAVVTDPPYGLLFDYDGYADTREILHGLIQTVMPLCRSLAKRVCVLPGITQIGLYPEFDWMFCICWNTTGSFGKAGFSQWMPALLYGADVPGFGSVNGVLKSDVIMFNGGAGVGFQRDPSVKHPCPKPENLMRAVINRTTLASEVVLDPFMGVATTGVACVQSGRPFVGIEQSPTYFDTACRRIEAATRQADLFVPAPAIARPSAAPLDLFAAGAE